jgi:hypothetical protein
MTIGIKRLSKVGKDTEKEWYVEFQDALHSAKKAAL